MTSLNSDQAFVFGVFKERCEDVENGGWDLFRLFKQRDDAEDYVEHRKHYDDTQYKILPLMIQ